MSTTLPSKLRNWTLLNHEAIHQFDWCPLSCHVSHCLTEARPVRLNSIPEMTSLLELETHQEFGIFLILRKKFKGDCPLRTIITLFGRKKKEKAYFCYSGQVTMNTPKFWIYFPVVSLCIYLFSHIWTELTTKSSLWMPVF